MALMERRAIDRIEILEDEMIQVRFAAVIIRDGQEINRLYDRIVLEPGQDVTNQPSRIRRLAGFIWTPQVVADYQAAKAARPLIP